MTDYIDASLLAFETVATTTSDDLVNMLEALRPLEQSINEEEIVLEQTIEYNIELEEALIALIEEDYGFTVTADALDPYYDATEEELEIMASLAGMSDE